MVLKRLYNPFIVFNIVLLISFSISVNSFTYINNLNILFYIFFHLTFIYFLFYHYHYFHFFLGLIYGVFLDILLLNSIGSHLICFITLILSYILLKKYLFLLSPNQIGFTIFVTLNITIYSEIFLAFLIDNIYFTFSFILKYIIISFLIFVPSIFILNKIDRQL